MCIPDSILHRAPFGNGGYVQHAAGNLNDLPDRGLDARAHVVDGAGLPPGSTRGEEVRLAHVIHVDIIARHIRIHERREFFVQPFSDEGRHEPRRLLVRAVHGIEAQRGDGNPVFLTGVAAVERR